MNKAPEQDLFGGAVDAPVDNPTPHIDNKEESGGDDSATDTNNDKGGDGTPGEPNGDSNLAAQRKYFQTKLDAKDARLAELEKEMIANQGNKGVNSEENSNVDLPNDPNKIAELKTKLEDRKDDMTETEIDLFQLQIDRMESENSRALNSAKSNEDKASANGVPKEYGDAAEEEALRLSGDDYEVAQAVLDGLKELNLSGIKSKSDMIERVQKAYRLVVSDSGRKFQQDGGGKAAGKGGDTSSVVDSIIAGATQTADGNYEL